MFGRRQRIAMTAATLLALLAPVLLDRDDHPLSTYPMYARTRSNVVTFATAQIVEPGGDRSNLSLSLIGASDDPLIVAGELRAAIGRGESDRRCREIADRIGEGAGFVEVVTERHDTIAASSGGRSLIERVVHARCQVGA